MILTIDRNPRNGGLDFEVIDPGTGRTRAVATFTETRDWLPWLLDTVLEQTRVPVTHALSVEVGPWRYPCCESDEIPYGDLATPFGPLVTCRGDR